MQEKPNQKGEAKEVVQKAKDQKNEDLGEDEDVPGDFFDDFLKEDFMAGLDIVDDDEWGDENSTTNDRIKKNENKGVSKESASNQTKMKKKKSPVRDKHKKCKKDRKHDEKEDDRKNRKTKEKVIDADEFDIRRDPLKTKRDIERDKARCEKKIITEKLNLVETGLVPPGMEMEIDVEEIKMQKEMLGGSSKSRSPRKRSVHNEKTSPKRRRTRSPRKLIINANKLLNRMSPSKRSPLRRSSPRKSPRRLSPRRSPMRRSPVRRSRERIGISRRSRSMSPLYRNRRSRYSPHPRLSPAREYPRHRRSRSRSRSSKRRRDEKKSFLQEIAEKLNETRPPLQPHLQPLPQDIHYIHPTVPQVVAPVPVPAPAPVPPPILQPIFPVQQQMQSQHQQYDPYDQNFFIGTPGSQNFGSPQPQQHSMGNIPLTHMQHQQPVIPNQSHANISSPSNFVSRSSGQLQEAQKIVETKEDISKLFQDKKISLSEFLAITAKPEVFAASPEHLQEKIKVISRCQDAIKILGTSEKKFTGRLIVHKVNKIQSQEDKFRSPLIKLSQLKIPFTDVPTKDQHISSFTNNINHLLQSIGLMNEVAVEVEDDRLVSEGNIVRSQNASPPPPPNISLSRSLEMAQNRMTQNSNRISNPEHSVKRPSLLNQLSKMIQTDDLKCGDCERRKKIIHRSTAVQCGGNLENYSVTTQVTEDDFYVKIPKNQSLASLTPAQLLAKSSGSTSKFSRNLDIDNFDIYPNKSGFSNRQPFNRPMSDMYGLLPSPPRRFAPPSREEAILLQPPFNSNPLFPGAGRGRGNQIKTLPDSESRFGFNNYY